MKKLSLSDVIVRLVFVAFVIFVSALPMQMAKHVYADEATPSDATSETTTEGTTVATTEQTTTEGTTEATTEGTSDTTTEEATTESSDNVTTTITTTTTTYTISSDELDSLTEAYTNTLQEKNDLQEKINYLMENQNDYIERLHELDDLIIEYQNKIDDIEEKSMAAYTTIADMRTDYENAEAAADAQYETLKEHISEEYENGQFTYLDALLNATSFVDLVNKSEYILAIEDYDQHVLDDLTDITTMLANKKLLLEMMAESLTTLEEAYENEQDALEILSAEKEEQINNYQVSIDEAGNEMTEIEAAEADTQAKIAALEAAYNVSITLSDGTVNVTYNGDNFLWPMPSSYTISSYFGSRDAPTEGATTNHKGIDIPCSEGSSVIAVASGTVIYVGYLGNGGNAVIVDHGGGISTCYFHLSSFAVEEGDTVSAGQTICYSGNTGVSTGPHLHFAVRENGEYVNPLKYYPNVADLGNSSSDSED